MQAHCASKELGGREKGSCEQRRSWNEEGEAAASALELVERSADRSKYEQEQAKARRGRETERRASKGTKRETNERH
jgi:hypothetical protein